MSNFKTAAAELRKAANAYPGAYEESPWGELVVKVKGKVFVFLGRADGQTFGFSCKLPSSSGLALSFPFASPTGYGLGKSGWVTATFGPADDVPLELLLDWLDESFHAVAPKRLAEGVPRRGAAGITAAPKPAKPAARKRATAPKKAKTVRERRASR